MKASPQTRHTAPDTGHLLYRADSAGSGGGRPPPPDPLRLPGRLEHLRCLASRGTPEVWAAKGRRTHTLGPGSPEARRAMGDHPCLLRLATFWGIAPHPCRPGAAVALLYPAETR